MWCIVINFKDCTLTFNTGFHTQAIDDQVSLNRKLTFGHLKAYLEYIQLSCSEYYENNKFLWWAGCSAQQIGTLRWSLFDSLKVMLLHLKRATSQWWPMCARFLRQPTAQSRLAGFGAHFGVQKMMFSRFALKKRPT